MQEAEAEGLYIYDKRIMIPANHLFSNFTLEEAAMLKLIFSVEHDIVPIKFLIPYYYLAIKKSSDKVYRYMYFK